MRRPLAILVVLFAVPLSALACLWDRDTPSDEAKGMPEVVAVLTGRFARNPPLFYEVRLKRVTARLVEHPEDLEAYDDAAVACDRLGRGDEAIAWMKKKRARLDALDASRPATKEHLYRYHANLGTFLVHRWARQGGDRTKLAEVKAARDEIASALAINPDAHFGRESYQLRVLDWIRNPPKIEGPTPFLPNVLGWSFDDIYGQETEPKVADAAVRGLSGLVVLGNAWESVDIFHALNIALQRDSVGYERGRTGGRNTLAYFAWLRCRELIDAGKGSMHPDAPKGKELFAMLGRPDFVGASDLLDASFHKLRDEADRWQTDRTAFMIKRLKAGLHPDTNLDFWNGYVDRPAPSLPRKSVPVAYNEALAFRGRMALAIFLGVPTLFAVSIFWLARKLNSRERQKFASSPESR